MPPKRKRTARTRMASQGAKGKRTAGKHAEKKPAAKSQPASVEQLRIQELEAENRQLKAQLSDQRNSATMFAAPPAKPVRDYRGMAMMFGVTTLILIIVVILLA